MKLQNIPRFGPALLLACLWPLASGCSVKKMAINMVGNAMAESGETFSADDDPELVRDATPFALKMMESLLDSSPRHKGLLTACCKNFTMYSYAFLQMEAEYCEGTDYAKSRLLRERAVRMFRRAADYGVRSLEARSSGFAETMKTDPDKALAAFKKKDVETLYWAGMSRMALVSLGKDDPAVFADLSNAEKIMARAYELDPDWDNGSLHEFYLTYDGGRPEAMGGSVVRAREQYQKALELSGGKKVSTYLALAEGISLKSQNRKEFDDLVNKALSVDVDNDKSLKLVNRVYRRRALWLKEQAKDLFVE